MDRQGRAQPSDLSFDEAFCILDKDVTTSFVDSQPSEADVARLDRLLSDVSFDASRDEWLALLSRASDQPTDQTDPTDPADLAVSADDADSAARAFGATLCAVGVFDHVDDLVGLTSVAAYDPHPDLDPAADHSPPLRVARQRRRPPRLSQTRRRRHVSPRRPRSPPTPRRRVAGRLGHGRAFSNAPGSFPPVRRALVPRPRRNPSRETRTRRVGRLPVVPRLASA